MKPLGIKWPQDPIKALGIFFTYDKKLLLPKVVYTSSLLPTPENIIKELNHFIYNFLWRGKDKVTRKSVINDYEGGGIKMVDIESMI